jgi:hypothetical protein
MRTVPGIFLSLLLLLAVVFCLMLVIESANVDSSRETKLVPSAKTNESLSILAPTLYCFARTEFGAVSAANPEHVEHSNLYDERITAQPRRGRCQEVAIILKRPFLLLSSEKLRYGLENINAYTAYSTIGHLTLTGDWSGERGVI